MSKKWYAIQSIYGQEMNCENALLVRGYECYLPLTLIDKRKRATHQNKILTTEPLFPTYIFILMDEGQDDFHPVSKVPGVHRIVKLSERDGYLFPTSVPDELIAALKELEDEQGIHSQHKIDYQEGDSVRITGKKHPFKDEVAQICATDKERRVFALIEIMGRPVKVGLDYKDIEPA